MNKDWWKWGDPASYEHVDNYPNLRQICIDRFGMDPREDFHPPSDFDIAPTDPQLKEMCESAFSFLGKDKLDFSRERRLQAALGKSYHDVIRIFRNHRIEVPDAVLEPSSHAEVQSIVNAAGDADIVLVAVGGQTNVVGALTINTAGAKRPVVFIDLGRMDRLISIDETNMTARFQAGVFGPHLEEQLQPYGLTLGHFPQSFEFSTLGGWVVTRSAGQESTYYGKIEDMVVSVKVATPAGTIETPRFDKDAEGINLTHLFVGSEGALGIVTEVDVLLHRKPVSNRWVLALFPDFRSGSECLREIIQEDIYPSVCRLSDGPETYFYSQLKPSKKGPLESIKKSLQKAYLGIRNIDEPNIMMLRFEELSTSRLAEVLTARKIIGRHKGVLIPSSLAKNWEDTRFHTPYLRDTMMEHRIFIDTMETVVPWDKVMSLHDNVTAGLRECEEFHKEKGIIMGHISHIYRHGACLYFILICPMNTGSEVEQWQAVKKVVSDNIVSSGGSISHHHSVGLDHREYYLERQDPLGLQVLKSMKEQLDPKRILNPGKLFDT